MAALKERGRRLLVVDRDIKPGRVWSLCELVHRSTGLDFVIVDYDRLVVRAGLRIDPDTVLFTYGRIESAPEAMEETKKQRETREEQERESAQGNLNDQ